MKKTVNKKVIIIILCAIVIALVCSIFLTKKNKEEVKKENNFSYTRTITLKPSSLQETIVASGIIESQTTSTITSNTNATVSKINYAVGDYVEEGDIIIELDTTNINKQISKQEEKIIEQEESLQEKYDDAYDKLDDAEDSYDNAKSTYNSAASKYSEAKAAISSYQATYDEATSAVNEAYKNSFEDESVTISEDNPNHFVMNPDIYEYANKVDAQKEALDNLNHAKQAYNYESLLEKYNQAASAYSQAKSKYKEAESSFENAEKAINEGVDSDDLNDLYDSTLDYKLKAKTSGQITNINAVLGSSTNGTLATIQDTNKLKISLTIDEYDILKLSLGMKAIINTDASDKTYEGEVSQMSPVASSSMGSSGGFEIEIKVTSEDISDLLIGMNAEVTIVVSETNENFNVPIDAIEEKEDGRKVIYVQNQNGEFDELEVTTGESNGYYIEIISNELKQGMVIRASANSEQSKINTFEEETAEEEFRFNDFGMGQGGMPQAEMPQNNRQNGNNRPGGGRGNFNE